MGLFSAIFTAVFTGVFLAISKVVITRTDPYSFALVIMGGTFFLLLIYSIYKYKIAKILQESKSHWRYLVIVGILSATLNLLSYVGMLVSSPMNAAILARSDVLFSALIGHLFLNEKILRFEWIIVGILMSGLVTVLNINNFAINTGDIFFVLSTFLIAVNAKFIKYNLSEVSGPIIALFNSFTCTVVYLLISLVFGKVGNLYSFVHTKVTIILTLMAIFISAVTFLSYYTALRFLPIWAVRTFLLLVPVVSLLIEIFAFHQRVGTNQIMGMLLICIGIIALSFEQKMRKKGINRNGN